MSQQKWNIIVISLVYNWNGVYFINLDLKFIKRSVDLDLVSFCCYVLMFMLLLYIMYVHDYSDIFIWCFTHISKIKELWNFSFDICHGLSLPEMHSGGNDQWPRCHPTSLGILGAWWPNTYLLLGRAPLSSTYGWRSLLHSTLTPVGG